MQTPEYKAWASMKARCSNSKRHNYHRYGGRGICVCERWLKFENFLADMGPRPSPSHSLDRYPNNDGNYEPGNCRWATRVEQAGNRSYPKSRNNVSRASHLIRQLSGQRFGRLSILHYARTLSPYHYWAAKCDCGNLLEVEARQVIRGFKRSCGCLYRETHNISQLAAGA